MKQPVHKAQIVRIPQKDSKRSTITVPKPSFRRTGIILFKSAVLIGFSMVVLKAYKIMVTDCRDIGI